MFELANALGRRCFFSGGSQHNGLRLPTMRMFRLYNTVLGNGRILFGVGRYCFQQRHGDIDGNVLGTLAAASCWTGWKGIVLIWMVEWAVGFVGWTKEPSLMTVETAHMSTAQAGNQHTVDHLAANDAR